MYQAPAVLASGTGSLFAAMLQAGLPIKLLLVDRKCRAIDIAKEAGIPVIHIHRTFDSKFNHILYSHRVINILHNHNIDLVIMAGFMTILGSPMFHENAYAGRILNTHTSLLPSFKGHHAVRKTLSYGVKLAGCTIHIATEELDTGTILAQESVPILPEDTEETLTERIKVIERVLYPKVIQQLLK